MFKRIALAITFVAAFSMVGLTFTTPAEAWRYHGAPYAAYYGPPRAYGPRYYAPYRTYSTYYGAPSYYGPRIVRPYYYGSYYSPGYSYYSSPGISVSVGL
jgi:hypothetical protein